MLCALCDLCVQRDSFTSSKARRHRSREVRLEAGRHWSREVRLKPDPTRTERHRSRTPPEAGRDRKGEKARPRAAVSVVSGFSRTIVLGKTRRVHFIGIGGIGMSGIAELLANLGFVVSGSDEKPSAVTDRLETLGIRIAVGHDAAQVGEADVVVASSAVRSSNPEVIEAARRQIPVIPRAEMLAELMRLRFAIAVAGSHGKTTTTSMIALVLERAGLDPTAVIGGRLSAFGSNARLGRGELMVAEADESDRSFLKLFPTIAVMTNIDHEHLENYGGFDDLQQAFVDFANKVPFYGAVIACADDPNLTAVLPRMTRRVTTYGLDASADVSARDIELGPLTAKATVTGLGT